MDSNNSSLPDKIVLYRDVALTVRCMICNQRRKTDIPNRPNWCYSILGCRTYFCSKCLPNICHFCYKKQPSTDQSPIYKPTPNGPKSYICPSCRSSSA